MPIPAPSARETRELARPFLVCIHDASPAFARETRTIVRSLAPLVGRRMSFGVVPDWHGAWPLSAHPGYCRLLRDSADELLLHGLVHRRARGRGPATLLTGGADEMNGLDGDETRRTLARGQRVFADAFGAPARGFLPPAWQRGHLRPGSDAAAGIEHVLGFFSVDGAGGRSVPLATWSWHCGRWAWLGHVGHAVGRLSQALGRGVPSLAIHPLDVAHGFWPTILRLTRDLIDAGYEPTTAADLVDATHAEAAA